MTGTIRYTGTYLGMDENDEPTVKLGLYITEDNGRFFLWAEQNNTPRWNDLIADDVNPDGWLSDGTYWEAV